MKSLEQIYRELKEKIDEYIAGDINATDLKHESAPLGIYQQRNDLFMIRIRVTGGHISLGKLQNIADIMDEHGVGFSHITSRQDLQLQDVAPLDIYSILEKLTSNGMPFRGGGGNTYRNILVSSESGISQNDVFDVLPHATALNEFMFNYDKAFELPRKLKMGFSSGPADSIKAIMQDLGFIAKIQDGEQGFEVYGGGGMGKESIPGVKLFDFLPEKQFAKCAKAITDLFHDHGDRTDRNKARLRFVLKRLGKDKFIELFHEYFEKIELNLNLVSEEKIEEKIKSLQKFKLDIPDDKHYAQWLKYAVSSTEFGDDIISLRLFLPYGNLQASHIRKIANLAEKCGLSFVRLTQSQDILFPVIHKSALPVIFEEFQNNLKDLDLSLTSFRGHLTSCIGAKVCKIGITDSSGLSDHITEALDELFLENPEKKSDAVLQILKDIKISGCPNVCSGHAVSKIGLQGMKKRLNDILTEGAFLFTGGSACREKASLASSDKKFLSKDQIAQAVILKQSEIFPIDN
jgi:ferredoxin-nitrite reductase